MSKVPAAFVQRIREAAFLVGDPKLQMETLTSIPEIGPAAATVVLAFHNPTTYVVGDRYMVAALLGEDRALRRSDYPRLRTTLRNGTQVGSISGLSRKRTITSIERHMMSTDGVKRIRCLEPKGVVTRKKSLRCATLALNENDILHNTELV